MRTGFVLLLTFLVVWAIAPVVRADEPIDFQTAIKQAVIEFNAGNWMEARVFFKRAHELNPSARTFRSLGITAFELRRYVDAIAELEAALADGRKPLTGKDRADVQKLLARARKLVAVYHVSIDPPDAEVLVDGAPASLEQGQLYLDPGEHSVVVRAPGYVEERKELRIAEPEQATLAIRLQMVPPPEPEDDATAAPTPVQMPPVAEAEPVHPRRRVWTWVLGGAALAAAGTGVGLGVAAVNKHEDFQRCEARCDVLKSKGQALQLGANVTLGAAGALAIGAVLGWFLEGRHTERPPTTAFFISPQGVAGLTGRF